MSFKREGDDPAQLRVLQKRRVADLLANYIPEDEALLLRSGRFACTVCAHRPVFDTLDVLTVHRAGKRHTSSLQRFYGGKRSPQDAAPRRHEEAADTQVGSVPSPQGCPAPLLARTRRVARSALLRAAPYSSCCRRTGLEGSSSRAGVTQTPAASHREAVEASAAAQLPGHRGGRAGKSRLAAPGLRWHHGPLVEASPFLRVPQPLSALPGTAQAAAAQTRCGAEEQPVPPARSRATALSPERRQALSPERRQALQHYLQLRSAGWIQDPSGKWVKDENAEFDSDEDEPPALPPP
ncbi:uncharacterized protein LJ264_014199 [Porphyrio hochstetteri]